jgi:hypothetical protein
VEEEEEEEEDDDDGCKEHPKHVERSCSEINRDC